MTRAPHKEPTTPKRHLLFSWGVALTFLATAGLVPATGNTVTDQIQQDLQGDWGQIKVNLRYRYEQVEQDGLKTAKGDPIRLRLGYLTPKQTGFQGYAELEGNTALFFNDYNDTGNGKTSYAVIADPSELEINQAWFSYDTIPDNFLKIGRQRIIFDNQRFVGPVGWRQMEQTFGAITLLNSSLGNLAINATYIWNVRTIFSKDVGMRSPLINLQYSLTGIGTITGYGYWLDYDDPTDSGPSPYSFSTRTTGLRLKGRTELIPNLDLLYSAEYASQADYQDNPQDYSADYYHLLGGLLVPNNNAFLTNNSATIGYEILGSDAGVSLKTPLGTNHAFNGWADIFLTAPPTGLHDLYAILSSTIAGLKVDLIYHDFQADQGNADYGTEYDAMLTKKFAEHYSLQAVYANYDADTYKRDTQKFWLQLTVSY